MADDKFPTLDPKTLADTRDAIHAYSKVAGAWCKVYREKRKHWWHASLRPSLSGLTTGVVHAGVGVAAEDHHRHLGPPLDRDLRLPGSQLRSVRAPQGDPEPMQAPRPERPDRRAAEEMAEMFGFSEARHQSEKQRYEEALKEAIARGRDVGAAKATASAAETRSWHVPRSTNGRKRSPGSFARVLLAETSLPLEEIVSLTGLDIYTVVGMKLKLRASA